MQHGVLGYHANSKFDPAFPWVFRQPGPFVDSRDQQ